MESLLIFYAIRSFLRNVNSYPGLPRFTLKLRTFFRIKRQHGRKMKKQKLAHRLIRSTAL